MTGKYKVIDTNKYFVEIIDESRSTIGYTVVRPEKLLEEIIRQNKQLSQLIQENKRYIEVLEEIDVSIKSLKLDICNNCGWHNTDGCDPTGNVCEDLLSILDTINKVQRSNND